MGIQTKLKLPKEHGAWGMLYVPFLVGVLVARRASWRVLLLGLAVTFVFIARESLVNWQRARRRGREPGAARRMAIIYLGFAGLAGAPLLLFHHLFGLVPLTLVTLALLAIHAEQAARREERTLRGEILAIGGLTLTAPAAHYVTLGAWQSTALGLWALSALYFTSSVFYVKLRVLTLHGRTEESRRRIRWACAFYHLFLAVALLVLALTGRLPLFALLAFAPVVARAFWHGLKPAEPLNLWRVGVLEIVYSLVFLALVTLAFHTA